MSSRILAGRYELLDKIGEGGMAVVFKSRDRLLSRYVAIKILRPEFTKDPVFINSFRRESQMAAGLSHPNIVNIYDVGKEGNIHYIVMELMEGEPLSDIIKRDGRLDPQKAANITRQIAMGLSAAHKNGLIHRDVKPHNIMFSDNTAKITDFGIAKKVTGETLVGEQKENVMGSVHYFSPEQARGGFVDEKSDIYSLGICLYEMLTAKVPFDGDTAVEVAVKHMNEQMLPPSSIIPDLPLDLEDIVMKAADKDPENRYKSMDEMITALNFVSYNRCGEAAPEAEKPQPSDSFLKAENAGKEVRNEAEEESAGAYVPAPVDAEFKAFFKESSLRDMKREAMKEKNIVKASGSAESSAGERFDRRRAEKKPRFERADRDRSAHKARQSDIRERAEREREKPDDAGERRETAERRKGFLLSPQRYAAVIVAVLLAVPASILPAKLITKLDINKPAIVEVTVPSVVGDDLKTAGSKLAALGLKIEVDLELVSKEYPEGQIMSQTPSADSVVKSDQTIRVNVSKGSVNSSVPNITGKSLPAARTVMESYGYSLIISSYQQDKAIDKDYIISQSPKSGTELAAGGKVYIVVSSGAAEVKSFDIIGKSYSEAVEILATEGYSVGVRTNQASSEVNDGCIIKYSVNGDKVDLWVSSGLAGGGSQTGDIKIDGYVVFNFSFDGISPETEAFTVRISIVDDNGSRTLNESCVFADGSKTLYIGGAGSSGEVTIVAEEMVYQLHNVNFQTGQYE